MVKLSTVLSLPQTESVHIGETGRTGVDNRLDDSPNQMVSSLFIPSFPFVKMLGL